MDAIILWVLSLTAVVSALAATYYETQSWRARTRREDQWRVMMLVLILLSVGTFIVATLALLHDTTDATIFAAFNRSVLAGAGIYVAAKSRERRRGRSDR